MTFTRLVIQGQSSRKQTNQLWEIHLTASNQQCHSLCQYIWTWLVRWASNSTQKGTARAHLQNFVFWPGVNISPSDWPIDTNLQLGTNQSNIRSFSKTWYVWNKDNFLKHRPLTLSDGSWSDWSIGQYSTQQQPIRSDFVHWHKPTTYEILQAQTTPSNLIGQLVYLIDCEWWNKLINIYDQCFGQYALKTIKAYW